MKRNELSSRRGWLLAAALVGACALLFAAPARAQTAPKPNSKTHLNGKPSAMVSLAVQGGAGDILALEQVLPNGTAVPGPIPAGAVLVVTDVGCAALGAATTGRLSAALVIPSTGEDALRCTFDTTLDGPTEHIAYTAGQVLSEIPDVSFSGNNAGSVRVRVHGYYVKDK